MCRPCPQRPLTYLTLVTQLPHLSLSTQTLLDRASVRCSDCHKVTLPTEVCWWGEAQLDHPYPGSQFLYMPVRMTGDREDEVSLADCCSACYWGMAWPQPVVSQILFLLDTFLTGVRDVSFPDSQKIPTACGRPHWTPPLPSEQ